MQSSSYLAHYTVERKTFPLCFCCSASRASEISCSVCQSSSLKNRSHVWPHPVHTWRKTVCQPVLVHLTQRSLQSNPDCSDDLTCETCYFKPVFPFRTKLIPAHFDERHFGERFFFFKFCRMKNMKVHVSLFKKIYVVYGCMPTTT